MYKLGFVLLTIMLLSLVSTTGVWADSDEEVRLPLPREVVAIYGLEPLDKGRPETGNKLTVISLETGNIFSFNTNRVTISGTTKTGEPVDYMSYVRSFEGRDCVNSCIGKIWAFRNFDDGEIYVWITILPFYPWW